MIGFLGGSFDPIHDGHLHLATTLLKKYSFEKFYFVPAKKNPLKNDTSASGEMRLKMVQAATIELSDPRIAVLDWEINRKAPSYTLTTVEELQKKEQKEIVLILGNEVFSELPKWHEPEKLLEAAHCVVVNRDDKTPFLPMEILEKLHISNAHFTSENRVIHSETSRWIESVKINPLPFSATQIREDLKEQWNKNELQNPPRGIRRSVWLLIKDYHLYSVTK